MITECPPCTPESHLCPRPGNPREDLSGSAYRSGRAHDPGGPARPKVDGSAGDGDGGRIIAPGQHPGPGAMNMCTALGCGTGGDPVHLASVSGLEIPALGTVGHKGFPEFDPVACVGSAQPSVAAWCVVSARGVRASSVINQVRMRIAPLPECSRRSSMLWVEA